LVLITVAAGKTRVLRILGCVSIAPKTQGNEPHRGRKQVAGVRHSSPSGNTGRDGDASFPRRVLHECIMTTLGIAGKAAHLHVDGTDKLLQASLATALQLPFVRSWSTITSTRGTTGRFDRAPTFFHPPGLPTIRPSTSAEYTERRSAEQGRFRGVESRRSRVAANP